ncbi:hypothetical protein BGW39_011131 [Mortierella sp. 14UC]|nr:hypothetical protein BGW39_011131 [Mortierella sp. 14UC]
MPQNATLVSESEFDRIFRDQVTPFPSLLNPQNSWHLRKDLFPSPPKPPKSPQLRKDLFLSPPKRPNSFRFQNDLFPSLLKPPTRVWLRMGLCLNMSSPQVNSRKDLDALKTEKLKVTAAVSNGIQYWKSQCGSPGKEFFDHWTYLDSESSSPTANIWFYFVKGAVCKQPAAYACAFSPQNYGKRTTVFVNWDKFKGRSFKAISMIMAHEIGHVLGLAHENIDKETKDGEVNTGDNIPLWKVSPYDEDSIMHSYFDISKELTKTDCRSMSFYNDGFTTLKCGFVDGRPLKCKKLPRNVVQPKDVRLNKNEETVDLESSSAAHLADVADYTCVGSDMSQYILNDSYPNKNKKHGYLTVGFGLTQCLGVRMPSDPDYAYVMQSDGKFVSYNTKTGKSVWSTQSQGRGVKGDYSIVFQGDGNLVI